jgi:hypothetical protein
VRAGANVVAGTEWLGLVPQHPELLALRHEQLGQLRYSEVGALELHRRTLVDPEPSHLLLVHTAIPGGESYEKP